MMSQNVNEEIPVMPEGVQLVSLPNGLTIIVLEDHSAPVVSAQAWCCTGSIHEGHWLGAGLSHVLEHMLFKGTTTRGSGRIDQEVQEVGGYMNAYTSFDRTVYWINVPNTGAKVAVDILADIMQNATLPPDDLAKELDVIRREMDMNQDDPGRRASRRLFETAYAVSPYRYTVIGYPDIFNDLKPADILSYYRSRYIPNNIFFVVVGDIESAEVIEQLSTAFSKTKARPLMPMLLPEEPPQMVSRELIEYAPIEQGHFHFSWHIPSIRHADIPTLDVIATLLGNGRSSRLFQNVREKKRLVNSADAWTYNPGNPGLFGLSGLVDADKFGPAKDALLEELARLQNEPVPPAELSKVIKQFIAGTLATRKTMQGQAQDLGGSWIAARDLNFSRRYLQTVKKLTPDDLLRVARTHLVPNNRTLYALLPKTPQTVQAQVAKSRMDSPIQKLELPNGLRVLVKEDHRLPFVETRLVFRGGVLTETPENSGITGLTAKLLMQGTRTRSGEQIATEIESLGGSLDSFSGNNSFGVATEVLSDDFDTGLHLLADVVLNPVFPSEAFDRERDIQLAHLKMQKDQMLQSAGRAMRQALFGNRSYGLDALGSEESLAGLKVEDLEAYHTLTARPNNAVMAIFGDIKFERVKEAVEREFADWEKGEQPSLTLELTPPTSIIRLKGTREKKQAVLLIGFPGVDFFSPDRFALELIQEACSDLGSRLFVRIRENLGLAYYVGAQHFQGLAPGFFAFYAGTSPEKTSLVESELLKEIDLLRSEGLTEEELKRAKAKILGQKKIARQDLGSLASTTALDELYGLGFTNFDKEDAKFEAVTLEQVQKVAFKYFTKDAYVVSILEPVEAVMGEPLQEQE